jgi:ABC-type nickel/cobalt efflux system permease component RcnA
LSAEVSILVMTAASVGFLHTLLGPDHYVPFVALARCRGWSPRKTFSVTALCGLGHIAGSVAIGAIGLLLGTMVMRLQILESWRGDAAAWLLIGFGLAYLTWGLVMAFRDLPHSHLHYHSDGTSHRHPHRHHTDHLHGHSAGRNSGNHGDRRSLTPWILFLIFLFGPCEVLIPLLMYPAAESNVLAVVAVVAAFAVTTIVTMVACVMLMVFGLNFVRWPAVHRYSHAVAGLAVLTCGILVKSGL